MIVILAQRHRPEEEIGQQSSPVDPIKVVSRDCQGHKGMRRTSEMQAPRQIDQKQHGKSTAMEQIRQNSTRGSQ